MYKTLTEKHFDKVAKDYDYYKEKNSFYYENLKKLLGELIPKNKTVLEFGCGTGDLLFSLNPKIGYGVDISNEMISFAKNKYISRKNLHFSTEIPFSVHRPLDYIFISDVIEHLENPEETFRKISKLMGKDTVFVNTMANPIWEPILMIAEKLRLKMPEGPHTRLTTDNLKFIINNSKLRLIKHDYKLLMPIKIPLLTNFVNKYLEKYFKKLAFIEYFVAVKV
jgi:ubiquinone/menaquinone biosynthesis C-methylase UbiE